MNRSQRQPTVIDVAKLAGVSKSTVSRVINDPERASAAARKRVMRACAELNYQPSSAARSLRLGKSDMVALMVGDISQPYNAALAKGMENAARPHGTGVMLLDLAHSRERLLSYLDQVAARGVRGVVIATADDIDDPGIRSRVDKLLQQGVAVVTAAQSLAYSDAPSVRVDQADTAYRATRHLYESGCRRPVLVVGDPKAPYSQALVEGFRDALAQDDADQSMDGRVLASSFDPERNATEVSQLLASGASPDGFVAASVYSVLGVHAALEQQQGKYAAKVVCCEEVPLLDFIRPKVDSFGIDYDNYATRLFEALNPGGPNPDSVQLVRSHLHQRSKP